MHPLCAIQVENSENRRRVRLRRYSHQRQACDGAKIHRNDAGSLFESVVETFHYEYRVAGFHEVVHDAVTRFEMRLRESPPLAIHAGCVSEAGPFADHDEAALRAADFKSGIQDLAESGFGREEGFPLILKIENARDFLEVGNFRWKNDSEIDERLVEDLRRVRPLFQRS